MRKAIFVGLLTVVLAQAGVWVICEIIARAVALETEKYRMIEPFFTRVVLGYRNILWLSAAIWVAATVGLLRRPSKDPALSVAFISTVCLFCVALFITAAIACLLPWLPLGTGPFNTPQIKTQMTE